MDRLSSAGMLAARVLLSVVFLFSGVGKALHFSAVQSAMAGHGMKMTGLFLVLAILVEVGGGLSVLLGCYPRLGALALMLFLAPVTLVFHRNVADPAQLAHLLKNLAIAGGLAAVVSAGGGVFSAGPCRGKGKEGA